MQIKEYANVLIFFVRIIIEIQIETKKKEIITDV